MTATDVDPRTPDRVEGGPETRIETPAVLIDLDRVEANLKRAQDYADAHGIAFRPHIKTHRLPLFALRQVELGASGITCQKLGEAEVMADAGLDDIFLTFPIIGEAKLERLAGLHARIDIAVVADSAAAIEGYAARFTDPARPLRVLVEGDTGAGRCGVQTPAEALDLARRIDAAPGLAFGGLMTYPPRLPGKVDAWLTEARDLIEAAGIAVPVISSGGSPDMYEAHTVPSVTEHRAGTYIYSDRMQIAWGLGSLDDCALTVLATVVSRPTPTRAVLDAGSKALAADTCPAPGFGHIVEYPDAVVAKLSEEHGVVELPEASERPAVGEVVHVIPNHACVISNLYDHVVLVREGRVVEIVPVAARGRSD